MHQKAQFHGCPDHYRLVAVSKLVFNKVAILTGGERRGHPNRNKDFGAALRRDAPQKQLFTNIELVLVAAKD